VSVLADYEWGERRDMLVAMPPCPRTVLDVGCGAGMGFLSLVRKGVTVVGVDADPAGVAKARSRLSEAVVMDVERDPWPAEWTGRYDVVAFCDCLEHLVDPWRVLRDVRPLLRPGGRVVASLPNLRQWRLVVKLLAGRWRYHDEAGIMNRGHLRFFTRQTICELFAGAGYGRPTFHFQPAFHLRGPERVVSRLALGGMADLLYSSHTVSAEPAGTLPPGGGGQGGGDES
jgi:SAM-dependent methyltransferase